jgi:hypothetical protein
LSRLVTTKLQAKTGTTVLPLPFANCQFPIASRVELFSLQKHAFT